MNKTTWIVIVVAIIVIIAGVAIWHYQSTDNGTSYGYQAATSTDQQVTSTVTTNTSSTTPVAAAGGHCGGNMLNAPVCGSGYQCEPTPGSHLPFGDVGGTCVAVQAQGSAQY